MIAAAPVRTWRLAAAPRAATFWWLYGLAAATYLITLRSVQVTGEEGVYLISSYEMWWNDEYLKATLYGLPYLRPPLYNWCVIAVCRLLGWSQLVVAGRLVSALATLATGLVVAGAVRRLTGDGLRAALAALVFITQWDILCYYGWLAYGDTLFALCLAVAMLCAWLAVHEQRMAWLAPALLGALGGVLCKALTALPFYALALLAALVAYRGAGLLRRAGFWSWHLAALAALGYYFHRAPSGGVMAGRMVGDILVKLAGDGWRPYLAHLLLFPLVSAANLLPWLVAVPWLRRAPDAPAAALPRLVGIAAAIAGLNFMPYWLAPQSGGRYLLPLYALTAIALAAALPSGASARRAVAWVAAAMIVAKVVLAAWLLPLYTQRVRADVAAIAADVARRSAGAALYVEDDTWVGLGVALHLDLLRRPAPPLQLPPPQLGAGFVLAHAPQARFGRLVKAYKGTYLMCLGPTCPEAPAP